MNEDDSLADRILNKSGGKRRAKVKRGGDEIVMQTRYADDTGKVGDCPRPLTVEGVAGRAGSSVGRKGDALAQSANAQAD